MFQRITGHPVVSAVWAVSVFLATIGGAWYFFTSEAPGAALYRLGSWLLSMNLVALVLIVSGLLIPIFVVGLIAVSAARSKREVVRLSGALEASKFETGSMRQRLVEGNFLIRAYSPEFPQPVGLITLKTREELAGDSMGRMVTPKELAEEHKRLSTTMAELSSQRDSAVADLKAKKHEYAMEVLDRYSNLKFTNDTKPRVTVRYCTYGTDYELAMKIKGLFDQHIRWVVTLELATKPALPRADQFKVVFDVGMTHFTYGPLVHAFSEGDLLGVTVGVKQFVDREDSDHLIVLVLPSAEGELLGGA